MLVVADETCKEMISEECTTTTTPVPTTTRATTPPPCTVRPDLLLGCLLCNSSHPSVTTIHVCAVQGNCTTEKWGWLGYYYSYYVPIMKSSYRGGAGSSGGAISQGRGRLTGIISLAHAPSGPSSGGSRGGVIPQALPPPGSSSGGSYYYGIRPQGHTPPGPCSGGSRGGAHTPPVHHPGVYTPSTHDSSDDVNDRAYVSYHTDEGSVNALSMIILGLVLTGYAFAF